MAAAAVTSTSGLELDDMQGLVLRGYRRQRAACFLLYTVDEPVAARAFLTEMTPRLTTAATPPAADTALNLAVTVPGLVRLGLPARAVATCPLELREGMATPHRSRILGDLGENAPEQWRFGGPSTPPVHLMLLAYATDEVRLAPLIDELAAAAASGGASELARLETTDIGQAEHFGFHDGISQPRLEGVAGARHDENDTVRAGELVLGYPDEYGLYATRPLVEARDDPARLLPDDVEASGRHDLGRNGSYLVLRQLEQDVPAFWRYADAAAGDDGADRRTEVAAKLVGRWPSGAPLVLAAERDDPALEDRNDFRYHAADEAGLRCPIGAHIRRANPRDSLDPNPGSSASIAVSKHHRLLRRGRSYGPRLTVDRALERGDGAARGLYFMCLNTNLPRQFEFVHQTWALSPKFAGLYDEPDPILTVGGSFSIPARPVRRRFTNLPRFVTVLGGAYFLLPGIRAVRYLGSMGGEPGNSSSPVGS